MIPPVSASIGGRCDIPTDRDASRPGRPVPGGTGRGVLVHESSKIVLSDTRAVSDTVTAEFSRATRVAGATTQGARPSEAAIELVPVGPIRDSRRSHPDGQRSFRRRSRVGHVDQGRRSGDPG
jgi:hypothetical protein